MHIAEAERQPRNGRPALMMADHNEESEVVSMEKYIMIVTPEQLERSKARRKAIDELKYNPMCYNCKSFGKSCNGSVNKIYTGCIYKEVDESKPSIYAQIAEQVK